MAVIDYGEGVLAVDADYLRPGLAAIHLLIENGRAAIIDTATHSASPLVFAALAEKGISPEQVDYIILTHIHLDHAGGAGVLMRQCPNARLTVHPRGVSHMADPGRLVAGVSAVYGIERTKEMYGDILPISSARIVPTPDGSVVHLAGRPLRFYETPGHARHHVAVHDEKRTGWVFAGDTFGLSYRELDEGERQFVFPTTSPVQFDPIAYHRSIDRVASLASDALYVTHFSRIHKPREKADVLHRLVDAHAALAVALRHSGERRPGLLYDAVRALFISEARRFGSRLSDEKLLDVYGMDVELNAQGLDVWLNTSASAA